ncbi:YceI family protein [Algoriphagus mannitolivorans]|uniref:YceI family protein n=1 Tax=Algoriphagus mannitolivorans TaxID=226504 RepID=UPI00041CA884|nr:YceI family protein [Algoriphagus mannitolivorans]
MMKRYATLLIPVIFFLFLGTIEGFSQAKYQLAPNSQLKVEGGSTLHDWHMETKTAKGEGLFVVEAGQFKSAKSLTVQFQAETLKSGTKGLDNNAYKALNTQQYKEIRFVLKELTGSGTSFMAKGDLTIAGVTKPVGFPVKLTSAGDKFTFEGSLDTKLTAFSITPPTALMGTVKTDDEVKLSFKTTFQPTL